VVAGRASEDFEVHSHLSLGTCPIAQACRGGEIVQRRSIGPRPRNTEPCLSSCGP
jgi:hypothetical protein